ncbi:hypothetical protein AB1Y20_014150 [Prymnesium parvum]|uniref:6-phosphofructo-2-kinase domain-containing protein n=1 Tax=Prymnesium parvum TaxID=97485 RepID=A0AB34IFD4_PRYPA
MRPRSTSLGDPSAVAAKRAVASMVDLIRRPMFCTNPHQVLSERVVLVMVGLPARGKSYISKAVMRYLQFLGCPAKMFNAGNKRRKEGKAGTDASFFSASNVSAAKQRDRMALECLDELLEWLQETTVSGGCAVGIFDATNTTKARRHAVIERVAREKDSGKPACRVFFIESLADDEKLLENNYRMKLANEDYKGADPAQALADFRERVRQYEAVYEPLEDEEFDDERYRAGVGYLKMINAGSKTITFNGAGSFLLDQLLGLLHSIHLRPRCLWFVLVGETANDLRGILGGDSHLSREGREYARAVGSFLRSRETSPELRVDGELPPPAMVLCGTLRRYSQMAEEITTAMSTAARVTDSRSISTTSVESFDSGTASAVPPPAPSTPQPPRVSSQRSEPSGGNSKNNSDNVADEIRGRRITLQLTRLNELCAGKLDSLSYDQMRASHPAEYHARMKDKLNYRFPGVGGESYQDVIMRLEEVVLMMERCRENMIVVCDRAVQRVLLSYFLGTDRTKIPYMEITAGVVELRRSHSGYNTTMTEICEGAATRAAGPGTRSSQQAMNFLEAVLSLRGSASSLLESSARSPKTKAESPRFVPSFISSPFSTKVEYERWVASGAPLPPPPVSP